MTTLTTEELATITLKSGSHATREEGVCAMEAVAWLAGERHSDAPKCACPVIGGFLRSWNDALTTDESRQRLLLPLLPLAVSTRADDDTELMRSYMALDWLIRVHGATWMQLAGLDDYAKALSGLDELDSPMAVEKAVPLLDAAREVAEAAGEAAWEAARATARATAWAATWEAAGAAAGEAARTAAWAATWEGAGAAAGEAARTAAWAATWEGAGAAAKETAWDAAREVAEAAWGATREAAGKAAWDAAREAAGKVAWDAAREALALTVAELQDSAQDLVRRMVVAK